MKFNAGDLVRFSGMYVISRPLGKQEVVMTIVPREGIIMHSSADYINVYSENQICFISLESSGSMIEVISECKSDG